jgi:hypothetical protein
VILQVSLLPVQLVFSLPILLSSHIDELVSLS